MWNYRLILSAYVFIRNMGLTRREVIDSIMNLTDMNFHIFVRNSSANNRSSHFSCQVDVQTFCMQRAHMIISIISTGA